METRSTTGQCPSFTRRNIPNAQSSVIKIFFMLFKASQETKRSVAVNTEMHERFETQMVGLNTHLDFFYKPGVKSARFTHNFIIDLFGISKGDINKMQKSITSLEEQIEKISSGGEEVHLEDLTDLKDEIQKITANTQVQISGSSNGFISMANPHPLFFLRLPSRSCHCFSRSWRKR